MRVASFAAAALLLLAAATSAVSAAPSADEVTSLPDMPGPMQSKHYSGYVKGTNGAQLHYYWVNAIDVAPSTAPVVLWTNGGPGCSSMDGWGYELGPFHFKNYNTSGATFKYNEFTWARIANVVFLENPPGVGFSYRPDGNYSIDDTINAQDNLAGVKDLFASKFPEFAGNDFWIAGESYGGIYVPTLSRLVLNDAATFPGFKGMLVGNGVTSHTYDFNFYYSDAVFAHGHGFMTDAKLAEVKAACVPPAGNPNGAACTNLSDWYYTTMAPNVNMYDYSGRCFVPPKTQDLFIPALSRRIHAHARKLGVSAQEYIRLAQKGDSLERLLAMKAGTPVPPSPQGFNVPCIDSMTMTTYLNRADVKQAIHVPLALDWAICAGITYTDNILDVVSVYNDMIAAGKRVLIYNGNTDMSVPYTGTRAWIEHETTWAVSRELRGWSYNDPAFPYGPQQGGFATSYANNSVWFTLVNGAGHMVPQFRPAAAYAMFERFLTGTGF